MIITCNLVPTSLHLELVVRPPNRSAHALGASADLACDIGLGAGRPLTARGPLLKQEAMDGHKAQGGSSPWTPLEDMALVGALI